MTNNTDSDPNNNLTNALDVTMDCPSARVWFTLNSDGSGKRATIPLTLPVSGAPVLVYITGENKSVALGDAEIRATKVTTSRRIIYESRPVTVFWFDAPSMKPTTTLSTYGVYHNSDFGDIFGSQSGAAVNFSGEATLKPTGLSPLAPQISSLRLAFQQTLNSSSITAVWSDPDVLVWGDSVQSGQKVEIADQYRLDVSLANLCDSLDNSTVPLYLKQGEAYLKFNNDGPTHIKK